MGVVCGLWGRGDKRPVRPSVHSVLYVLYVLVYVCIPVYRNVAFNVQLDVRAPIDGVIAFYVRN